MGSSGGDWIAVGAIVKVVVWQSCKFEASTLDQLSQIVSKAMLFSCVQALIEQKGNRIEKNVVHVGDRLEISY